MAHPNVRFEWINKTHTKYHVFDEEVLLTGSINFEDRHRGYFDIMVELAGPEYVARFRERMKGAVPHDPGRPVDFLCNRHVGNAREFEIKPAFLDLIGGARESIYVEMAYLGDEAVTGALVAAARRGVKVSFLFSREANIGNDINYRTMHRIYRRAPVEVFLSPKMIHSKLVLVDGETAIFGSCNFSVFSLQKAGELQVVVRDDPAFCAELRSLAAARMAASEKVEGIAALSRFRPVIAALQQLHQKLNPN
jgi:cardiolipin synthase